jgi:ankyrin repeat protein
VPSVYQLVTISKAWLLAIDFHLNVQDADPKNKEGNTPMHYACLNGHKEVSMCYVTGRCAGQCCLL